MIAPPAHEQPGPDLYQVLGIDPGADSTAITRAYRRLARRHHPDIDTTPGAAGRFADITQAYRVLSNPLARARYDAGRARRRPAVLVWASGSPRPSRSPWTLGQAPPAGTAGETFWLGTPSLAQIFHLPGGHANPVVFPLSGSRHERRPGRRS